MHSEYESILLNLQAKAQNLAGMYVQQKEKNADLVSKIEQYELSLKENSEQLETLKTKYNNLKLAGALMADAEANPNEARQRLNRIIREIDQCIALLNK